MIDPSPSFDPMRERTEREAERSTRMLRVAVELCSIFARDDSENAGIEAIECLRLFFDADSGYLYRCNGRNEYLCCAAGVDQPITLSKLQWQELTNFLPMTSASSRFGPRSFAVPIHAPAFWLASCFPPSGCGGGFVLLGKNSEPWGDEDEPALLSLAWTLSPILEARRGRERAMGKRHQAEAVLATNEKRLRAFFEESRDMVYTSDANDIVTSLNAAGLVLSGKPGKAAVVGQPFSRLVLNPSDRALFLRKIRKEGFVDDYEFIMARPDDKPVFCLENANAVRDAEGRIAEIQGIIKDISERIRSEREFWKSNLELAEANLKLQRTQVVLVQKERLASIGQLAAGIAHEINNPLGFLKSNHTMLEKYFRSMKKRWHEGTAGSGTMPAAIDRGGIDRLFSEIDGVFAESDEGFVRIMGIVANLKSFSREDRSGEFEHYDLNGGIESTLSVAWNEIKYVAEVRKELGELPPLRAKGGEINQVILNILVNAAQAIEGQKRPGKGMITIRTAAKADRVILEIGDDGPGIPEAIRNRIFDPFFTTKEPGKGTGLGLSISYDIIVARHKGNLNVADAPGGGTLFTIELPVAGPPPQE
ncbi:MAG: ATP-binding protein [Spirochaetes bacterium]|nr:ATP-binding protein [Spirochaetota bacterium]